MKNLQDMLNESRRDDKVIEKKAFELSSGSKRGFSVKESNAAYNAALEMADWMKSQTIERVCKWLRENMVNYGEIWTGGWNSDSYDQDVVDNSLIRDLKEAMEK